MINILAHIKSVLLLLAIGLLTACGGGSSGGDNGITINFNDDGSISGSVDYNNSDFIKMNTIGAGTLYINVDSIDGIDIDCALTSSVGPSNFDSVDIIFDDYGHEVYDDSSAFGCDIYADFSESRSFYLFVDTGDEGNYSGDYFVFYYFGSAP